MNKSSLQIFNKLMADGVINSQKDSDLYLEYRKPEVRDELLEMENGLNFTILDVGQNIYLIPAMDNSSMSYSLKDFREEDYKTARLIDAYLNSYIMLIIFDMFYGGKNADPKQRDFLSWESLMKELDKRLKGYVKEDSNIMEIDSEYGVNFKKVAEYWNPKLVFDEGRRLTKHGTIMKVFRMLKDHKLVTLENDTIRTTQRLNDIFINYYLGVDRVTEIQKIFAKGE